MQEEAVRDVGRRESERERERDRGGKWEEERERTLPKQPLSSIIITEEYYLLAGRGSKGCGEEGIREREREREREIGEGSGRKREREHCQSNHCRVLL